MTTTPGDHYLHRTAGGMPWSASRGNEPVSMLRKTRSGIWAYIIGSDSNSRGWIRTRFLRPRPAHQR